MRLADEQLWPVPSLDVRSGVDSSAATLFVERARAVAPGISLAERRRRSRRDLPRLDGIPLAIELAASRLLSMTVTEVRDHLDDRFRLLVGSRRGLERHQTLRHAVQWSYDLLDDAEKTLLATCSVFAGGFDLAGAQAVAGSDDEFATLDLLDALVRKSLLVADRSSGRTRFSMLETIRQFAEEQLVTTGEADDARTAHARYFAGREADVLALGTVHDNARPTGGSPSSWRTCAPRSGGPPTTTTSTPPPPSRLRGVPWHRIEQHEPVGWAEELIEPARAVDHRRLAQLYVMAATCYTTGRVDDSVGYAEAAPAAIESGRFDEVPLRSASTASRGAYLAPGQTRAVG